MRPGWRRYALDLAAAAAARSEDQHYAVGAIVLRPDHSVAGAGYNGAPAGVTLDWADRDTRRAWVTHAEVNALRYTTPAEVRGGLLASTHCPCSACLLQVVAYGISTVVYSTDLDWSVYDQTVIRGIADAAGILLEKE